MISAGEWRVQTVVEGGAGVAAVGYAWKGLRSPVLDEGRAANEELAERTKARLNDLLDGMNSFRGSSDYQKYDQVVRRLAEVLVTELQIHNQPLRVSQGKLVEAVVTAMDKGYSIEDHLLRLDPQLKFTERFSKLAEDIRNFMREVMVLSIRRMDVRGSSKNPITLRVDRAVTRGFGLLDGEYQTAVKPFEEAVSRASRLGLRSEIAAPIGAFFVIDAIFRSVTEDGSGLESLWQWDLTYNVMGDWP